MCIDQGLKGQMESVKNSKCVFSENLDLFKALNVLVELTFNGGTEISQIK